MQSRSVFKMVIVLAFLVSSFEALTTEPRVPRYSSYFDAIGAVGVRQKCPEGQKFNFILNRCLLVWG
ncbi:hypothetical protein OUZ56_002007 [Daphnia magna]|uniref:Secreted protein n=1 Tax=Daphnia magna TaxID=35525 RepID=A0ABR0A4E3_9CRUS|nr:hypothetical protein OUZ56_002007 [Daphnia magna]